jgi:hypothetical protein
MLFFGKTGISVECGVWSVESGEWSVELLIKVLYLCGWVTINYKSMQMQR